MARDITVTLYKFDELSEKAKEKARDCWRDGMDFSWGSESRESIEAFCNQFGIKLLYWSVGPYIYYNYKLSEYDNGNFRGINLKSLERENYLTGYFLDASLSIEFYDVFKKTGDAKYAFKQAVEQGFIEWRNDMEFQLSDDYIDDCLIANEYEFTKNGDMA